MTRADRSGRDSGVLATSIASSAIAQLCMKAGMVSLHTASGPLNSMSDGVTSLIATGAGAWVFAGLVFYGISMVAWLRVLAVFALSYAYPLLSVSYVLVYAGAAAWPRLAEPMSLAGTCGVMLVVAGICLVTGSRSDEAR